MIWKSLFSAENIENIISLPFAEFAQRVVMVKQGTVYLLF